MLGIHAAIGGRPQHRLVLPIGQQQHIIAALAQRPQHRLCGGGRQSPAQHCVQALLLRSAGDKLQILRPQHGLIQRLPQIQAVAVDKFLGHGVNKMGDIPVSVHRLPDAGGADLLQLLWQGQLQHLAADAAVIPDHIGAGPAEYHMVEAMDGIRLRGLAIRGGVGHHVAAHHNGYLPSRERPAQSAQIFGVGNIHREILREDMHIKFIRHRHGRNLPPDAVGLGALRPGKLVDGQQHLKALVPDGPDNTLVGQGKGVKGAGKEGHRPRR